MTSKYLPFTRLALSLPTGMSIAVKILKTRPHSLLPIPLPFSLKFTSSVSVFFLHHFTATALVAVINDIMLLNSGVSCQSILLTSQKHLTVVYPFFLDITHSLDFSSILLLFFQPPLLVPLFSQTLKVAVPSSSIVSPLVFSSCSHSLGDPTGLTTTCLLVTHTFFL